VEQRLAKLDASGGALDVAPDEVVVVVRGVEGTVGGLWLRGVGDLEGRAASLLEALAGTAGALLEQGIRAEAVGCDAQTGLPFEWPFLERVAALVGPASPVVVLYAFRVGGLDTIREAQGGLAVKRALVRLASTVRSAFPADTPLGVRFSTVLAARAMASPAAAQAAVGSDVPGVKTRAQMGADSSGSGLSVVASHAVLSRPLLKLSRRVDRLMRDLDSLSNERP